MAAKVARKNFRFPEELVTWVAAYAKSQNTTMTRLIIDYFTDLRKRVEGAHVDQF